MAQAEQVVPVQPATAPLDAARPRVFYGWWIVLGAIVAQFIAMGQNQVTNVILGPMTSELGWSRSEFTIAATIGTLLSGVLGFVIGAQVDRRGARPLILIGTVISSAALVAIAYIDQLWQFWALRGVALVLGNVMVGNLVVNVTISKWFVDRRGWAIAMAALGVSSWSFIGTQLIGLVVDVYGWRAGWTAMGAATWILLPVALVMTRQPEDRGLLPDGRHPGDAATEAGRAALARAQADSVNSLTRGEAARTPALWLLILAFGLALTGMTALFAHLIQFFVDVGFTPAEARYFYSLQGLFSLIAKFVWGAAMQRLPAKWLVATSFSIAGVATLGLVYTASSQPWQVVAAFAALWGLATGGMIPLSEFVWASYFGRRHIGAVRGLGLPFTVMLTAGGPLFASEVFDRTGSYNLAMVTFAGMWFAGALLILVSRRPRPLTLPTATVPLAQRLRTEAAPPAGAPGVSHAAMASALASTNATPEDGLAVPAPAAASADALVSAVAVEGATLPLGAYEGAPPRHRPRRPTRSYMGEPRPSYMGDALVAPSVPAVPAMPAVPPSPVGAEAFEVPAAAMPALDELMVADSVTAEPAEVAAPPRGVESPSLPVDEAPSPPFVPPTAPPALEAIADSEAPSMSTLVEASTVDAPTPLEPPEPYGPYEEDEEVVDEQVLAGTAALEVAPLEDIAVVADVEGEPSAVSDVVPPEEPRPLSEDRPLPPPPAPPPRPPAVEPRAVMPSPARPPARPTYELPASWLPRTTGEAILAGIITSIVATIALWLLTHAGDEDDDAST
ncbi:MAG: MFS transporter [Dehalococcoidia bacterium]|nr:MFS transporter [Dehalococcoidia bacterium]